MDEQSGAPRQRPDEPAADRPAQRRPSGQRVLRALEDVSLTIGAGHAMKHSSGGGTQNALADRLVIDRGRSAAGEDRAQDEGLLERLPGWVIALAAVALVALAAWWGLR